MEKYLKTERKKLSNQHVELVYEEVVLNGKTLRYVPTSNHSLKRIRNLESKEPTTLPWIDTFLPGDVYVDVGANVGMYTIYAGVAGAKVYAFEPESQNYAELNKNIYINDLYGNVTAYCMAISDVADISLLYLSVFSIGFSHHDFGENRWTDDLRYGQTTLKKDQRPEQGCVSFPLDHLMTKGVFPAPNHLKIDVDGFEDKVIGGAQNMLRSDSLQTVLLEVDFRIPHHLKLIDQMTEMGWHFSKDQVRMNQREIMSYEDFEGRKSRGKGGTNYIFYKKREFYDAFFTRYIETFVPPNPFPVVEKKSA